jgi:hypothetical protein
MSQRYEDYAQVNGATVNDALDRAESSERDLASLLTASKFAFKAIAQYREGKVADCERQLREAQVKLFKAIKKAEAK